MMAIVKPIKVKAIVIKIRGLSILGSIDGEESLLMLAGWWRVFHQSTEYLITGKLNKPIIAIIDDTLFAFSKLAIIFQVKIYAI